MRGVMDVAGGGLLPGARRGRGCGPSNRIGIRLAFIAAAACLAGLTGCAQGSKPAPQASAQQLRRPPAPIHQTEPAHHIRPAPARDHLIARAPTVQPPSAPRIDPATGTTPSALVVAGHAPIPKGGGSYKLGSPYKIAGRWYTPQHDPSYDRTGVASWYGDAFHGRKTANGEVYDMNALTAAHPTLPLPSYVWVTNIETNRTLLVRVNDRGPYAQNRIIDLSRAVARRLGSEGRGLAQVRVRYAGPAPLDGNDQREQAHLRSQPWSRPAVTATAPGIPFRRPMMLGGPRQETSDR